MTPRRAYRAVGLAAIVAVGFALRIYRLDALSLRGNEDYLAIGTRSVLENLWPVFPSGIVYPRALPLTYLCALLAKLIGFGEVALRLPSVLFGTGTIVLAYLLGRRLLDRQAGWIAALLVALSDWEVMVAHTARMYSALAFCVLLGVLLVHRSCLEENRGARWLALLAIVTAGFLHQIGAVLFVMIALLALDLHQRGKNVRFALLCMALVLAVFVGNYAFEHHHYSQWESLVRANATAPAAGFGDSPAVRFLALLQNRVMPLFLALLREHRSLFAVLTVAAGAVAFACLAALVLRPGSRLFAAALGATVAMLYVQQWTLAVVCLVAYVLLGRAIDPLRFAGRAWILAAAVGAGGLFWLAFGLILQPVSLGSGDPGLLGAAKATVKALLVYPPNYGRIFVERYTGAAVLVLISVWLSARRYLREGRLDGSALVALLFAVPVFMLGLHPDALSRPYDRYAQFANPLFLLLVADGAVRIGSAAWARLRRGGTSKAARRGVMALLVPILAVLALWNSLPRTLAFLTTGHGENPALHDPWLGENPFFPDHRGPSTAVCREMHEGDLVVAMDILAHYSYCPRVDYQLTLADKPDAEGWIGVPRLGSAAGLEQLLDASPSRVVWVVLSGVQIRDYAGNPEMQTILDLLHRRGGEPVFRGADGLSDLYRIPVPSGHSANGSLPKQRMRIASIVFSRTSSLNRNAALWDCHHHRVAAATGTSSPEVS